MKIVCVCSCVHARGVTRVTFNINNFMYPFTMLNFHVYKKVNVKYSLCVTTKCV